MSTIEKSYSVFIAFVNIKLYFIFSDLLYFQIHINIKIEIYSRNVHLKFIENKVCLELLERKKIHIFI